MFDPAVTAKAYAIALASKKRSYRSPETSRCGVRVMPHERRLRLRCWTNCCPTYSLKRTIFAGIEIKKLEDLITRKGTTHAGNELRGLEESEPITNPCRRYCIRRMPSSVIMNRIRLGLTSIYTTGAGYPRRDDRSTRCVTGVVEATSGSAKAENRRSLPGVNIACGKCVFCQQEMVAGIWRIQPQSRR